MQAAIAAGNVRPALLYEGEFALGSPSDTLRLWTGIGDLVWNGKTFTGAGRLLKITPIQESRDLRAIGFTGTLSGMPSADISRALGSIYQGNPGTLWLAAFDSSWSLIADPYQLQKGRLDVAVIEDDGTTCTIQVSYESRLVDLARARERRYTNQDQQIDYSGDLGFDQVPALQDAVVIWG